MYTIRGFRGLGAGAFTGESFATGNRLAQQQVASNPIARATLANDPGDYGGTGTAVTFEDRTGQIAQARAEAEAAAAARRAADDAAAGGGADAGLSTGAKIAIGVGVGIAALALFSSLK